MWWIDTSAGAKGRCLKVAGSGESQSPGLIDVETCSNRWSSTVNNLTKAEWLWANYIGKLRAARRGRGRSISCYIVKAGSKTYEHIGATWLRLSQCGTPKSHHKGQPQQHLNPSWCHWMMNYEWNGEWSCLDSLRGKSGKRMTYCEKKERQVDSLCSRETTFFLPCIGSRFFLNYVIGTNFTILI